MKQQLQSIAEKLKKIKSPFSSVSDAEDLQAPNKNKPGKSKEISLKTIDKDIEDAKEFLSNIDSSEGFGLNEAETDLKRLKEVKADLKEDVNFLESNAEGMGNKDAKDKVESTIKYVSSLITTIENQIATRQLAIIKDGSPERQKQELSIFIASLTESNATYIDRVVESNASDLDSKSKLKILENSLMGLEENAKCIKSLLDNPKLEQLLQEKTGNETYSPSFKRGLEIALERALINIDRTKRILEKYSPQESKEQTLSQHETIKPPTSYGSMEKTIIDDKSRIGGISRRRSPEAKKEDTQSSEGPTHSSPPTPN